ncbi:aspartate/glutamate racemase family protein [Acinetobacter baumannii]|uniref:aspartate/glutamate racemase family protein n=1 Tax=Acinetobacter baumannii TaxID=470 RepID=UPI000DD0C2CC|nr:aspartate/glutamate racemase family protein [Acinetobacter baumannii]
MKIKIINPNTTQSMTDKIAASAKIVANSDTQIIAVSPQMGPATIESYYDEALSAVGVLEEIRQGELLDVDAYVIACFGDPALYAAREISSAPVIGIAEAAMRTASYVSTGFSVVTTLQRTVNMSWHLAQLELPDSDAYRTIRDECKKALAEDKSDAIVLGCAGMSDLCIKLQNELGVIVIDGVAAAVKQAEMLVQLNLKTSKVGDWASPPVKNYTGILSGFGMS